LSGFKRFSIEMIFATDAMEFGGRTGVVMIVVEFVAVVARMETSLAS